MKILWIVNMLLPDAAEHLGVQTGSSGTWMIDISKKLAEKDNIDLAIACIYGTQYQKFNYNGITYYLLPGNGKNMLFYNKNFESMWVKVNEDFKPDIVHIHGTEYSHGLSFLRMCPDVKSVVSIQGMLTRIKDVDFGGVPLKELVFNRTLSQNLHLNGEIELHFVHKKNSEYEQEILRRGNYINGVSTWDTSICKSINPKLKCFKLEYNLREGFYNSTKWDIEKIEKYSIFTNPGSVPLKGLHNLLLAVSLIKNKYPEIKVYVPGMSGGNGKLALTSAYAKYIDKLIKKHGLEKNVVFLGRLNEKEMVERMLKSHAVVIPSAIEGASLVLREGMYLGCPSIATFRGGMADFISDKIDGFLYDFQEYPYLAARLEELFDNPELCKSFSVKAIEKTEKAHDRKINTDSYINMYNDIYDEGNEK